MGFTHLLIEWNPWLGTTAPRSPFFLPSSTEFVDPPPKKKKFLGTPLSYVTWISQAVTKKSTKMTTIATDWKVRKVFDTLSVIMSCIWTFTSLLNIWELTWLLCFWKGRLHSSNTAQISKCFRIKLCKLTTTHMIWNCTWERTENGPQLTWQQPMLLWNKWQER
jgi:hypothetical protein